MATGKLVPEHIAYFLGLYANTVQLPNSIRPLLTKCYLDHFGNLYFILVEANLAQITAVDNYQPANSTWEPPLTATMSVLKSEAHC